MYMRLAFAVAAHLEPEILIVDEVLAVGDAAFQKKCFGKMGDVAKAGRTVLVVSHTAEMLSTLCSTGVLLRNGRLAMTGPIESVLSTYLGETLNSSSGRFDVSDHKARSRQHRRLIRQVELVDEQCNPTTTFCSGRPFVARLTVRVDRPITDARLALAVEDYMGRRLLTVANYLSPELRISHLSGEHIVECRIPALRLGTGRYMVSVSLATRGDGLIDSLNCCGWFDVEARNWYGTGEMFLPVYGPVLETSTWTVS
jgi:lipopolysaccharide transport system ATP-binding protein